MEYDLTFGFKALVALVAFTVGMALGSLYAAVWLRLAATWLRMGNIPYLTAWLVSFAVNFVAFFFNFSIGFNHGLVLGSAGQFGANMVMYKSQVFLMDPRMDITKQAIDLLNQRLPSADLPEPKDEPQAQQQQQQPTPAKADPKKKK